MNPAAKCSAKNKAKCRFHGALARMRAALERQDANAYLTARIEAEAVLTVREPGLFEPKPDINLRYSLIGNLDSLNAYQQAARLPKPAAKTNVNPHVPTAKTTTSPEKTAPTGYMFLPGQPHDDYPYRVQQAGHETGTHCECGHFFTRAEIFNTCEEEQITCPTCGDRNFAGMGETYITPRARELFDAHATKAAIWWHSTQDANWEASLTGGEETPFIHAGTLLSALMRGRNTNANRTDVYLYELQILPEATVADTVYADEQADVDAGKNHPTSVENLANNPADFEAYAPAGVNRYINAWEDTGNLFIMTIPANVRVVGKRRIELRGKEWHWDATHVTNV